MTSIVGRQNRSAIGSLVERKSRYTRLVHLPNGHDADDVHDGAIVNSRDGGRPPGMR